MDANFTAEEMALAQTAINTVNENAVSYAEVTALIQALAQRFQAGDFVEELLERIHAEPTAKARAEAFANKLVAQNAEGLRGLARDD